jgi:hypothetical protein
MENRRFMNTTMELGLDEITDAVAAHQETMTRLSVEWDRWLSAYRGEFWAGNRHPWGGTIELGKLPIKMESNRLEDYIQKFVANLLFRAPRADVAIPGVLEARGAGRPSDLTQASVKVTALCNEWMVRTGLQQESTSALQQALFYGAAGYKLAHNRHGKLPLDRFTACVVSRWECLWDERESSFEQQLYRGHFRYERCDWVEHVFGYTVPEELRMPLPGPHGEQNSALDKDGKQRPRRYCKVLEFYDLLSRSTRWFLTTDGQHPTLTEIEKGRGPLPFELANGRPGVPLIPVIAANEPGRPLAGMSMIKRQYRITAELNLMLTILANAMRRDATRLSFMPEELLTKPVQEAIRRAEDGEVIPVPTKDIDWTKLIHTMKLPEFSQHIDKYRGWLMEEAQATSGISNIQRGQQGNYLSATEAEFLANSGETAATEVGARLTESLSRLVEMAIAAYGGPKGTPLSVRMPDGKIETLSPEELRHPWMVDIEDAAATPMRLAKRQQGFLGVQKTLLDLVTIASTPELQEQLPAAAAPTAAAMGAPAAAGASPPVTPEMRNMARAQMNFIATQWELDTMSWEAISAGVDKKSPPKNKAPEPVDPELESKVIDLLEAKQNMQPPPVPQPPPPPLV